MIWMKRFFAGLGGTYVDSLRAIMALQWLFAVIIGWEFAQHVVEVRIGMFDSKEAAKAVSQDGLRMAFGWVKMASIYVGTFFVVRHFAAQRDGRALAPVGRAARRFFPYFLYSMAMFALVFYAENLVEEANRDVLMATVGLSQLLIEPMLMAWVVAAATDGSIRTPWASARRTGLLYFLALPLFLLIRVPISFLHQGLNSWSVGAEPGNMWAMLALDALVVGVIVAIVPAAMVRVARWIELRDKARDQRSAHSYCLSRGLSDQA